MLMTKIGYVQPIEPEEVPEELRKENPYKKVFWDVKTEDGGMIFIDQQNAEIFSRLLQLEQKMDRILNNSNFGD